VTDALRRVVRAGVRSIEHGTYPTEEALVVISDGRVALDRLGVSVPGVQR
jgi:hypothetical protein